MENFLHLNSELYQALVEFPEGATISDLAEMIGFSQDELIEQLQVLIKLSTEKEDLYNYAFGADKLLFKSLKESDPVKLLELANFLILPADLRKKLQIQIGAPETITGTVIDFEDPVFWIENGSVDGLKKTIKPSLLSYYRIPLLDGDSSIWRRCPTAQLLAGRVCQIAAEYGQLDCLKWLYAEGYQLGDKICLIAAESGHLDCLKWLQQQGCQWSSEIYVHAAIGGHIDILKWAHENNYPIDKDKSEAIIYACMGGHIECLKWLHQNGFKCIFDYRVCQIAAGRGDLSLLQWAHQHGFSWNGFVCSKAAEQGQLESLKYAHHNGCPWNEAVCTKAARYGHLEILEWAHQNGCPWNEDVCTEAAHGHLEILKWAHQNGCPWNEDVCTEAARYGHLEILEWAHQNGCPWNEAVCTEATRHGHLEILKWAHHNGCPWNRFECLNCCSDQKIRKYIGCKTKHQKRRGPCGGKKN